MQKKIKIFIVIILMILLIFWAAAASIPMIVTNKDNNITENELEYRQFCGKIETKSNEYIKEYKIPFYCVQPLAITHDQYDNVWFIETNTGNIVKFDVFKKIFKEYNNELWKPKTRSMIWDIDYNNNQLWYPDEYNDYLWKFSIIEKKYNNIKYPTEDKSLPQLIKVNDSNIIINDFIGNRLIIMKQSLSKFEEIISPLEESVTGAFAIDHDNNIWYTNWQFQNGGSLIKLDNEILNNNEKIDIREHIHMFEFTSEISTPNGITIDDNNKIWLMDTSSSNFFKFDPDTNYFIKYSTSDPPISTYGNHSGLIKTPITRPYWTEFDNNKIIFNEQTANSIAVFNLDEEELIEYLIPTKNPNWADCGTIEDCGIAQIFAFTIINNKIWFTEWVENNIGVIDTSVELPFNININKQKISLQNHKTEDIEISFNSNIETNISIISSNVDNIDINIHEKNFKLKPGESKKIIIEITPKEKINEDIKILLGGRNNKLTISKYITIENNDNSKN